MYKNFLALTKISHIFTFYNLKYKQISSFINFKKQVLIQLIIFILYSVVLIDILLNLNKIIKLWIINYYF
jgi:hypothetical protein